MESPEPEIPDGGEFLWETFWELSGDRRYGETGPHPLTSSDIIAWCSLTGTILRPDEISILRLMDSAYRTAAAAEAEANAKRRNPKKDGHPA